MECIVSQAQSDLAVWSEARDEGESSCYVGTEVRRRSERDCTGVGPPGAGW